MCAIYSFCLVCRLTPEGKITFTIKFYPCFFSFFFLFTFKGRTEFASINLRKSNDVFIFYIALAVNEILFTETPFSKDRISSHEGCLSNFCTFLVDNIWNRIHLHIFSRTLFSRCGVLQTTFWVQMRCLFD